MKKELYKQLSKAGEKLRFTTMLYSNELDEEGSKMAKRVAKEFLAGFAKFCEDNELTMEVGLADFSKIGAAGYLAIKDGEKNLMVLVVPHDIIEVSAQ